MVRFEILKCFYRAELQLYLLKWKMALSGFEIAMGGIASIPVVGGLVLLGYKSFGESALDASKLKPKKKPAAKQEKAVKQEKSVSDKKTSATKSETSEGQQNPTASVKEQSASAEQAAAIKK